MNSGWPIHRLVVPLCCCSNVLNKHVVRYRTLFDALPDEDQCILRQAEAALWRCKFKMHAHLLKSPNEFGDMTTTLAEMWTSFVSAACSHIAAKTMLQHLDGSRPLADWSPVAEVCWAEWLELCSAIVHRPVGAPDRIFHIRGPQPDLCCGIDCRSNGDAVPMVAPHDSRACKVTDTCVLHLMPPVQVLDDVGVESQAVVDDQGWVEFERELLAFLDAADGWAPGPMTASDMISKLESLGERRGAVTVMRHFQHLT